MFGNPVRLDDNGYWVHELDGVEYGSIWSYAEALLAKYGIEYAESSDGKVAMTLEGRDWGWHREDTWESYYMGLVDMCEVMHERGIPGYMESPTSASNKTRWVKV